MNKMIGINKKKQIDLKKTHSFIYWTPRILSVIFLLFLMLFSFDVFGEGYGFWGTIGAFLIHNIPAFAIALILFFAWKKDLVGAIAFISLGIFYISMVIGSIISSESPKWAELLWTLPISGPLFLIGILFYIGWRKKRKMSSIRHSISAKK
jgi:hypothetical protein